MNIDKAAGLRVTEEPSTMKAEGLLSRRDVLALAGLATAAVGAPSRANTASGTASPKRAGGAFPPGFLWGVATAGHQVEGSNTNSDVWALEHVKPTIYAESSGDTCDQYQRYREDIALLSSFGFNSYRFSVEWSRIEPAPGEFLFAELEHYRRVLAACHEHGVAPVVTFNHGTTPRWFAALGGWENPQSPELFARYCERVVQHIGDLIGVASTLNEPNIPMVIRWLHLPPALIAAQDGMLRAAASASGSERFSSLFAGDEQKMQPQLLKAHREAYKALKAGPGKFPVGVNLAIIDDQAAGPDSQLDKKRQECYAAWLDAAAQSDYVGVQTYGRSLIGKDGPLPPPTGAELTQMGEEFYPQAVANTIRYAAAATRKPVYVTENGIATENDARRVAYIKVAVQGIQECLAAGIDVRSYIHWSLLDNFEWLFGFRPKFGLVAVNRRTQARSVKPSAHFLGAMARAHGSKGG
jgi:beta-glucosidase